MVLYRWLWQYLVVQKWIKWLNNGQKNGFREVEQIVTFGLNLVMTPPFFNSF
jgi:hypothetical protein